jgi:thermitase
VVILTLSFLKEAVDYALGKGVPIVACMMNQNNDVSYYPAAYPGVIAVGSTNPDDKRSVPFFWSETSGSNYGQHISVSAPGNYIYSISNVASNYGYYWGGTSMATPHVTGVASLMLSLNPSLSPADIKQMIEMSAEDMVGDPTEDVEGWDPYYGHGRLNAFNALTLASISADIQPTPNPELTIFPNPVSDFLHINTTEPDARIQIFDLTGKIIHQQHFSSSNGSIDVTGFSPGIYFIKVQMKNRFVTRRWIKIISMKPHLSL